ncbi:MAG: DUF1573 domain-containing protein [archaeon]
MFRKIFFILFFITGFAAAQSAPKISVKPGHFELGNIKEGTVVTKIYTIKNEGSGVLNIKDVRVSCGCTAAKPAKNELKPGEATKLEVKFNSAGRMGKQEKTVYIDSNDPANGTLQVTFAGNVVQKNTVKKAPKLSFAEKAHDFGILNEGKVAQYTFNFVNTGGSTLEIGYIVATGAGFATRVSSRKIEPGQKGSLQVEFDTSNLWGKVAKNIKINSNDPSEPVQTLIVTADIAK